MTAVSPPILKREKELLRSKYMQLFSFVLLFTLKFPLPVIIPFISRAHLQLQLPVILEDGKPH